VSYVWVLARWVVVVVGTVVFAWRVQKGHPVEFMHGSAAFLLEAGELCVVFGFIDHYITKKKIGQRNLDVIALGVICFAASVLIQSADLSEPTTAKHDADQHRQGVK
jgi:hypothetical protein